MMPFSRKKNTNFSHVLLIIYFVYNHFIYQQDILYDDVGVFLTENLLYPVFNFGSKATQRSLSVFFIDYRILVVSLSGYC